MAGDGLLDRLDLAFSRDQAEKIYVQTRMREHGAELFAWLEEGAHFYVCGDATRMAKDVDPALHEIVARPAGWTDDAPTTTSNAEAGEAVRPRRLLITVPRPRPPRS